MSDHSYEPTRVLRELFAVSGWIALLLKNVDTGRCVQRTGSLAWACCSRVQDWLRAQNAARFDIYVSVNALAVGAGSRTRLDVRAVRHVFLDIDRDAQNVLVRLRRRTDLPPPSYVVHTSPGRTHLLWRVRGFDCKVVERLQSSMAADLGGDLAATSVTQLTRLPGFLNQKYDEPYMVCVEYLDVDRIYAPGDFPRVDRVEPVRSEPATSHGEARGSWSPFDRAVAYLSRVPAAVAGHHGDLNTFQTCCRLVRGFALDDDQALAALAEWNARCQPPWTERELREKIRSARRNGREPTGGML